MEMESVGSSVGEAFSDFFAMPPMDVIVGMVGILFFGAVFGALMYLPVAHKASKLPLEYLSGELIWRIKPDWLIFVFGCLLFLVVSFLMVSGYLRDV